MKHRSLLLSCLVFVLLFFQVASANIGVSKISFKREDIKFEQKDSFDIVKLADCYLMGKVGEPALPVKNVFVALPQGVEVLGVEVISFEVEELSGTFYIHPAQPPVPLSLSSNLPAFVSPKDSVYNSMEPYPKNIVEYIKTGSLSGQRIAVLRIYPVQYIPSERKLKLFKDIQFKLNYTTEALPKVLPKRTESSKKIYQQMIEKLVINPEEITSSNYTYKTIFQTTSGNNILEYLIITNESLKSAFQPLADWKTKKGIPAAIRTTEWISSNYSGYDLAEKIREYLKIAHQDSGAVWVLLGGDTQVIPCRYAHMRIPICDPYWDLPSDLYYSDLDGNWDFNGNHIYGELEDNIDMFPELFVGRAPVTSSPEVQVFTNKAINYERTTSTDYQNKMLFLAQLLDSRTDGGVAKDMIGSLYVPSQFDPIAKLYERDHNTSPAIVIDSMNQGFNIINHNGHAWINRLCTGANYEGIWIQDIDNSLNNTSRYTGVLYSIGCWPAAIDNDCIAEHFCKSPNGGGFFVGNTRYGFYIPSFPYYGAGELFDQEFFKSLFDRSTYRLGQTLASSKIPYIANASESENDYRWIEFELLLLGDPELPLYTDLPQVFTAEYPETISVNQEQLAVTVTHNSLPVEDALVCIMQDNSLYHTTLTGSDGQAVLPLESGLQAGTLDITITAKNFLPWEKQITVMGETCLSYEGHSINDSLGNNDGIVNPGEKINLSVLLKNCRIESSEKLIITGTLETTDPKVMIDDPSAFYGGISTGDSAWGNYSFTVSSECPNGHVIYFDLSVSEAAGKSWDFKIATAVGTPILSCLKYEIEDGSGGNGVPDPYEKIKMSIWLKNSGLGNATGITATLSTSDSNLYILSPGEEISVNRMVPGDGGSPKKIDTLLYFPDIPPGDSAKSGLAFGIYVNPSCPPFHLSELYLNIKANDYSSVDTLEMLVGPLEYIDDMENGDNGWTYDGDWHQTTNRFHSQNTSWYCGKEEVWQYSCCTTFYLTSPPIFLGSNPTLSFWTWYSLESGMDYGLCQINDGNGWQLLETMTGGSSDSGSGWVKKEYDLSQFSGKTVYIRFTLYSEFDDIQGEGWYIDDLLVSGGHIMGVFGKITDFYTHQPVDSVIVEAIQNSQIVKADTTDPMGSYNLLVPPGEYNVRASKTGYLGSEQSGIWITPDNYFRPVNFVLDRVPKHDLALASISYMGPSLIPKVQFEPSVTIENKGTFAESFYLFFEIDSSGETIYAETTASQSGPVSSTVISLPSWTPGDTGTEYGVLAYIQSEDDEYPENDTLSFIVRPSYELYWDDGTAEGFLSDTDHFPRLPIRAMQEFYICGDCSIYAIKWMVGTKDLTVIIPARWDSVTGSWVDVGMSFIAVCDSVAPAWNYYQFDPPFAWEPEWGNRVGLVVISTDSLSVDTTYSWGHSWIRKSQDKPWKVYDQGNFMIRIIILSPDQVGKTLEVEDDQKTNLPSEFGLAQNYPNPFNIESNIEYSLPKNCQVKLVIYNILGQKIKTLVNEEQKAGHQRISWDGKNDRGEIVSSGIYFYKIRAGNFIETKRMMLLK
ncbi:MAG: C25 family cysteine peptidase [candidate division Zixibacteria bacterium]|nr:C25 family cysteine peptidase [candidate division Zixibacteria bacterium]